jgi:hypothetical protein
MRLPWKRGKVFTRSRPVSREQLELETAIEILSEVFHVRPADVEDMIQQRLDKGSWPGGLEDSLWPATFCLGN